MTKAAQVLKGFLIGSAIWFGLNLFLLVPLAGIVIALFIAPLVGGYAAGKYGGGISVLLLAILAPLVIGLLGFSVLRMAALNSLGPDLVLGLGLLVAVPLWGIFNMFLIGVGGGAAFIFRKAEQAQASAGLALVDPRQSAGPAYTAAQPEAQSTPSYCIHCGARSISQNRFFCPICGKPQRTLTTHTSGV